MSPAPVMSLGAHRHAMALATSRRQASDMTFKKPRSLGLKLLSMPTGLFVDVLAEASSQSEPDQRQPLTCTVLIQRLSALERGCLCFVPTICVRDSIHDADSEWADLVHAQLASPVVTSGAAREQRRSDAQRVSKVPLACNASLPLA